MKLEQAKDILTDRQYECLMMHLDGMSNMQIGNKLGITQGNAGFHIRKAKERLAEAGIEIEQKKPAQNLITWQEAYEHYNKNIQEWCDHFHRYHLLAEAMKSKRFAVEYVPGKYKTTYKHVDRFIQMQKLADRWYFIPESVKEFERRRAKKHKWSRGELIIVRSE